VRHCRVRDDRVAMFGRVTVRYLSRLHHVGIGFAVQTQPITLLSTDEDMRVSAEDSTLLRQLTPDQNRDSAPGSPAWSP
jgi:hypothetical protein